MMFRPIARLPRSVACFVVLAIVLIVSSVSAGPAAEGPSLDIAPSSIEAHAISKGDPLRVQVRLTAGGRQLTGITISSFSNDGVNASVENAAGVDKLPPKAEEVWMLRLVPRGGTRTPTDLAVNVTVAFHGRWSRA